MRIAIGTTRGIIVLREGERDIDTWALVSHAHQARNIQAVLTDPRGSILAASSQGSIHKTKDGENWMTTVEGLDGLNITAISSHPKSPMIMYVGTQPPSIYKSKTAGLRWQKLPSFNALPSSDEWIYPVPPYRASVTKLRQHPLHPNVVFASVAQGGFMGSLDGGLTWSERPVSVGKEVNDFAIHALAPNRIFSATSTGIFRSDDLGSTWTQLSHGIPYNFARRIAIAPYNPNLIMASLSQMRDDNGAQLIICSQDGGDTWQVKNVGLPSLNNQRITSISALGERTFAFSTITGNIYLTTNGGDLWRAIYLSKNTINAIQLLPK
ncbi:MAG: WD40/YVTN/BNR-like repeat-containing protein [Candidatus Bruticola sp.]